MDKNMKLLLTTVVTLTLLCGCAEDRRSTFSNQIDPDKSIFGLKYGASKNEVISQFGEPDGYIELRTNESVMVYGRTIGLLMKNDQLNGVHAVDGTSSLLNPDIEVEYRANSKLHGLKWEFMCGNKAATTLDDFITSQSRSLSHDPQGWHYNTEVSTADLLFGDITRDGITTSNRLYEIILQKKEAPLNEIVSGPEPFVGEIDPDEHIFGIKYGESESSVISILGKPNGRININSNEFVLIYGNDIALLFKNGELNGVRISDCNSSDSLFRFYPKKGIWPPTRFSRVHWKLTNGLHKDTTLSEIISTLGVKGLSMPLWGSHVEYETDKATVKFFISYHLNAVGTDKANQVYGIMVERK
jgi:hypothetical protein